MDVLDSYGVSSRGFKILYYGNLLFWVALALFLVIFIIRELMAGSQDQRFLLELREETEPFHIPDMKEILTWGFDGKGVAINVSKLYPGHQEEYKNGFAMYRMNKYLSDRISMRRPLPDVRSQECKQTPNYLKGLPSVSVIVVFRNEPRTTLLRMLYSVIDKSPQEQLQDIILVDDGSDVEDLQFPRLEHYVSGLAKVSIIRLTTYHGVAQARMHGAKKATGEVLIFLQPRSECTEGWTPPLLQCIVAARNTIAVPVVDRIDYDTFQYNHGTLSEMKLGSFTWSLSTKKKPITEPAMSATLNIPNPVIADGIFAVAKDTFFQLGGFEQGLLTEDSINIEFSFRSWMCGSEIVLVPCSHVGYLALMAPAEGSEILNSETISDNLRIANTWMSSYKYFVIERMKVAALRGKQQLSGLKVPGVVPPLHVSAICKSFEWYLQTMEPAMLFASEMDRRGEIFLLGAKNKILTLAVWDGHIVLQDSEKAPVTFWYHLKCGSLVTENKTCLSYKPDNVKTVQAQQSQYMSISMDLEYNNFDSDYRAYDHNIGLQRKEAYADTKNQVQLNSAIHLKASINSQQKADKLLFDSESNSVRHHLSYNQELDLQNRQQQHENDLQFQENLSKFIPGDSQVASTKLYETQIRSRSLLNSIVHRLEPTRPIMEPPTSNQMLDEVDQVDNTHESNDQSVINVILKPCDNEAEGDQWIYNEGQALQHVKSGLCMEAQESMLGKYLLNLVQCDRNSWAQQWKFGAV